MPGNTSPETLASYIMNAMAKEIEETLTAATGNDMGFCLLVFNTTPGARVNYVSNSRREDVAEALKELLDYWALGNPDIPAHQIN